MRVTTRRAILGIFLPSAFSLGVFALAAFGIIVPSYRRALLSERRRSVRELCHSGWSLLDELPACGPCGTGRTASRTSGSRT